jgi:iron-sulfur cluster assembly accessory protein
MKHLIGLTKAAEEQFRKLFLQHSRDKILLKINKRGCSGNSYQMDFVDSSNPFDESIPIPGGMLIIDQLSIMAIAGTTIDWVENGLEQRFIFNNPNATNHCGCGESFYTEEKYD